MTRLLALGDSYTIGEGVEPSEAWPQQVASRLELEPTILAATGWTSGELLRAVDAADLPGPYEVVSLSIGVNDQFRGLPRAEFVRNSTKLLIRAHRLASVGVLLVSIPDWGVTPFAPERDRTVVASEIDDFNADLKALADSRDIPLVDVTALSRADPTAVTEDGLHPSADQYQAWAEAIAPAVEQVLLGSVLA